jgi:hypothetical protein
MLQCVPYVLVWHRIALDGLVWFGINDMLRGMSCSMIWSGLDNIVWYCMLCGEIYLICCGIVRCGMVWLGVVW